MSIEEYLQIILTCQIVSAVGIALLVIFKLTEDFVKLVNWFTKEVLKPASDKAAAKMNEWNKKLAELDKK